MTEDERSSARTRVKALGASLGVSVVQALTIVVVFMPFWAAADSSPSSPEGSGSSDWEGFEPAIIGFFVAPAVAMIVGAVLARLLRLRLFGMYALGPVAAFGSCAIRGEASQTEFLLVAFVIGAAWNLVVVALADKQA